MLVGLWMVAIGYGLAGVLFGLAGFWAGAAASEALHRVDLCLARAQRTGLRSHFPLAGRCLCVSAGSRDSRVAAGRPLVSTRCSSRSSVWDWCPGLPTPIDDDLLEPATRAMFVVAPVNVPPARTLARLNDFVRKGGSLIVLDDSRIGERGSAKDFLGLFGASISYHAAQGQDGTRGRMSILAVDGACQCSCHRRVRCPEAIREGQVVYMSDAADFSRQGMGHCFARPWKPARARYETIFTLFRDVLRIAPTDRRFYGILIGSHSRENNSSPKSRRFSRVQAVD